MDATEDSSFLVYMLGLHSLPDDLCGFTGYLREFWPPDKTSVKVMLF